MPTAAGDSSVSTKVAFTVSTVCIAFIGLLPLAIGLRWLQLFIFTSYRSHHRPVMIPLGIIATCIGLVFVLCPLWTWAMVKLTRLLNRHIQDNS